MKILEELIFLVFKVDGSLNTDEIQRLSDRMATGIERVTCSYNPDDEDYKKGFVTIDYWLGVADDTQYVDNQTFFEAIEKLCENHIESKSDDREELEKCLSKIKNDLQLS